jgi:C_GCAxxG_C_C family probable redox protein
MQHTCGAVTGALMALGLKHGKGLNDDESRKQKTYALTRKFCEEFTAKHGSLNCRELLSGLDMNDPDQNMKIKELGLHDSHCAKYVRDAVGILETLIICK